MKPVNISTRCQNILEIVPIFNVFSRDGFNYLFNKAYDNLL